MKRTGRIWLLIVTVLGAWLVSACESRADLWLYKDQTWRVKNVFKYDPDMLPSIGFGYEGIEIDIPLGGLTDTAYGMMMEQACNYLTSTGVDATYKSQEELGGDVKYTLEMRGDGLDTLRATALGGDALEMLGQQMGLTGMEDIVSASIVALGGDQYRIQMTLPPTFGLTRHTICLHAGRIISSNANQTIGGTATWRNPQQVDVTFTPVGVGSSAWIFAVLGGVGAVGLGAGAFALLGNKRPARVGHNNRPIQRAGRVVRKSGKTTNPHLR